MIDTAAVQALLGPLFPGLMGVRITALAADRVSAELPVRPDLCTAGGILHGGATMAFADTLGAVGTLLNLPTGKRTTTTERLRVFRSCPLITPKVARSSLQMRAIARAMAVLCA